MSEWIEYAGSDEQIEEILKAKYGYIVRYENGEESTILHGDAITTTCFKSLSGKDYHVTNFLICNPHPLTDMIQRWADTGQPVYIKTLAGFIEDYKVYDYEKTTEPNWNVECAEYSFTPFEEQACEE